MAKTSVRVENVSLGRLFLWLENPRHDPVKTEQEAIRYLCEKESVLPIAKDIAENGLNPLDRVAFVAIPGSSTSKDKQSYHVVEGNRRLSALKLLRDPELAPPKLKSQFEKLAKTGTPIISIEGVVFPTKEDASVWLKRIHTGAQDGIGRRSWTAEQQARFDGDNKNKDAQLLLDFAQKEGLIAEEERGRKITTVQRFFGNAIFRDALGVDKSPDADELLRTRPPEDVKVLTEIFMRDLVKGTKVNSRMNSDEIKKYARSLVASQGVSGKRVDAVPVSPSKAGSRKGSVNRKPSKPDKARFIASENEITIALIKLGNEKLKSLYFSMTDVELENHTPLLAVGTWSFFETLTACNGRNEGTPFHSFLSKSKLQSYGITGKTNSLSVALQRINEYGNATKHDKLAALFNGQQLHNDIAILKEVILASIDEAISRK
jgi:hypothetical protein